MSQKIPENLLPQQHTDYALRTSAKISSKHRSRDFFRHQRKARLQKAPKPPLRSTLFSLIDRLSTRQKTKLTIGVYIPIKTEPLEQSLIHEMREQGHRLYAPKIDNYHNQTMSFHSVQSLKNWEKNVYGILEPPRSTVPKEDFDLLLVPALAVTSTGERLGSGLGYYDRYLLQHKPRCLHVIATVYDHEIVTPEHSYIWAAEEHDIIVDGIVTPQDFFLIQSTTH